MRYARSSSRWIVALALALLHLAWAPATNASNAVAPLPQIGLAPHFTLTDQNGKRLSMRDLRGQVVVVTFIFTTCSSTCPVLTAKLVDIQRRLGADQPRVFFAAVTVDPLNDTPAVLKKYAQAYSADLAHFAFLTGTIDDIDKVTRSYAVYVKRSGRGDLDHTFLTSLVDPAGVLRVQYLGTRFDSQEFLADLKILLAEGTLR